MSELVRNMQEWRAVSLISSELIDEVKELVREKAALEAKLEAMEREVRRLTVAVDARDVTIKTMRQLAAAQETGDGNG